MDFLAYLKSMPLAARSDLALRCGTSVEYLMQLGRGVRAPKISLAITIERETGGAIRCEDLLPDVDWDYLKRKFVDQVALAVNDESASSGVEGVNPCQRAVA